MSSNGENQKTNRNLDERMEALTAIVEKTAAIVHDIAFSQKLHADMIVSLDTQMQQLSAKVDKLAEATARNTENIQALTENAAKLDIKFERLAAIMTGLLQKHDERIAILERTK